MLTTALARSVQVILLLLMTTCWPASAQNQTATERHSPYVSMNVGIEINGLEQAAAQAAEGLTLIGESLHELATHQELTPEQHQQVQQTLARVEQLGASLNQTVDQLPVTVEKGFAPVVAASQTLSDEIRLILIIACLVLVLIIVAALAAVYYFVLAPATRSIVETTELLNRLANTLETTAQIVETSSNRNLEVIEALNGRAQSQASAPEQQANMPGTTMSPATTGE